MTNTEIKLAVRMISNQKLNLFWILKKENVEQTDKCMEVHMGQVNCIYSY